MRMRPRCYRELPVALGDSEVAGSRAAGAPSPGRLSSDPALHLHARAPLGPRFPPLPPGRCDMHENQYDVIVVGARCAGSSTAMLLARYGYRVLVVDRSTFPSDTISTHLIHPPGVAALRRWGLLDRVVATGCPPVHTYAFDFGAFELAGAPGTPEGPVGYAPRRTVLD